MPGMSESCYKDKVQRMKERRAKLIAKGINPRSNKFYKLLYRK